MLASPIAGTRPGRALGLAVLVGILLAMVAPVIFHGDPQLHRIDLGVYREGGSTVLRGGELYAPSFGQDLRPPLPFTYPPIAALLASLMAWLPRLVNDLLWTAATLATFVVVVTLGFRQLLVRAGARAGAVLLLTCVALVWTTPVNDHLGFGQVNLFLMGLVLADALANRPRWPRGLLIGLAAAIKLIPGVFVLYLLATGQTRAARTAVLAALGATALGFLVLPDDSWEYWTHTLRDSGRIGDNASFSNQSLHGVALRVLGEGRGASVVWVLAAVVVLGIALRRARTAHAAGDVLTAVVLVGLAGSLVSPVSWIHHLVWLLPALGLLVADGQDRRRVLVALVLLVALWARLPYVGQHIVAAGGPFWAGELLRDSYAAICLGLLLCLPLARRHPAARGGQRGAARRATRAAWTPAP